MILTFGILNMFLPAVLISICYIWIVIVIWRRSRKGFIISNKSGIMIYLYIWRMII